MVELPDFSPTATLYYINTVIFFLSIAVCFYLALGPEPKTKSPKRDRKPTLAVILIAVFLIMGISATQMYRDKKSIPIDTINAIETAYAIHIPEEEWPRGKLENRSPFLINYTKNNETHEGKVVVENNTVTIYTIIDSKPLSLATN